MWRNGDGSPFMNSKQSQPDFENSLDAGNESHWIGITASWRPHLCMVDCVIGPTRPVIWLEWCNKLSSNTNISAFYSQTISRLVPLSISPRKWYFISYQWFLNNWLKMYRNAYRVDKSFSSDSRIFFSFLLKCSSVHVSNPIEWYSVLDSNCYRIESAPEITAVRKQVKVHRLIMVDVYEEFKMSNSSICDIDWIQNSDDNCLVGTSFYSSNCCYKYLQLAVSVIMNDLFISGWIGRRRLNWMQRLITDCSNEEHHSVGVILNFPLFVC